MLRSMLNVVGPRPLAVAVFIALAGCGPSVEQLADDAVCAGVQCTAGQCYSNANQAMCRCGAWEEAAGVTCQVATFVVPDDHGGSPEQASELPVSMDPLEGRISAGVRGLMDRDLFSFHTEAGHSYIFVCEPLSLPSCFPRLLDAAGRQVSGVPVDVRRTSWLFPSLPEGRWYVEVSGAGDTGTYRYQLLDVGPDDFGNVLEQATAMEVEGKPFTVTSTFLGDRDIIRFRTVAGHGYRFSCELPRPDAGLTVRLVDDTGKVVSVAEGFGVQRSPTLDLKVSRNSEWYVEAVSTFGQMPVAYSCVLADLGMDEHGDVASRATPMTPGVPITVRMHSLQDVDLLAFTAKEGHGYILRQQPEGLVQVRLANASGLPVDSLAGAPYVNPRTPGTYHLMVTPARGVMSEAPVQLVLEDLGPDDHGDSGPYATISRVGTTVTGRFHAAQDVDAITFEGIEADGVYRVTCEPECLLSGLGFQADRLSSRTFDVSSAAPASFNVWRIGDAEGFSLRLERVGTDDHGERPETATPLTLPASMSGLFEVASDVEAFSVELEPWRTYRLVAGDSVQVSVQAPDGYSYWLSDGRFTPRSGGRFLVWVRVADVMRYGPWSFTLQAE